MHKKIGYYRQEKRRTLLPSAIALVLASLGNVARADGSADLFGQTGLIQMPDGRVSGEGEARFGYNHDVPYRSVWASIGFFDRLETSAVFLRYSGLFPFTGQQSSTVYGDDAAKIINAKFLLNKEDDVLPSVAIGATDLVGNDTFDTGPNQGQSGRSFRSQFIAASKHVGPFDLTLGYGRTRINGIYGGVKYAPTPDSPWTLVVERDKTDYATEPYAVATKVGSRRDGFNVGVNYRYGWLDTQVSRLEDGHVGLNFYVSVPFGKSDFIPKFDEPKAFDEHVERPTLEQWRADPSYRKGLIRALQDQDFRDIRFDVHAHEMKAALTNTRIAKPSRAVGRAAQTMLAYMPFGTQTLRVTYTQDGLPFTTYYFGDVDALRSYFNGEIDRAALVKTVRISRASRHDMVDAAAVQDLVDSLDQHPHLVAEAGTKSPGDVGRLRLDTGGLSNFQISPKISTYFNDPSGVLHYNAYLDGYSSWRVGESTFISASATQTLYQNISAVTEPSNSLLPHVRSDIAKYENTGKTKLESLLYNQFYYLDNGWYARTSAGIYEQMFGGAGGQLMYVPESGPWAFDLAVDRLRQRGYRGDLSWLGYETTTAIASVHYRIPSLGIVATARTGRFLAGDFGTRLEFSHRFASGAEMGLWYTVTNGNDITSPGSPTNPYHDKGITLSIPINILMTKDNAIEGAYAVAPWTRDVGQMVVSPGDLYDMGHTVFRNRDTRDGLSQFGDLNDDYPMKGGDSALYRPHWDNFTSLAGDATRKLFTADTAGTLMMGGAGIWLASRLDNRIEKHVPDGAPHGAMKVVTKGGDYLPWLGLATAGALSLYEGDQRLSNTAYASVQAALAAGAIAEAGKYAIDRERPVDGSVNPWQFGKTNGSSASFPSSHVTVASAVLTPFALEYDMPVLSLLPGVTAFARLRERQHWFSDVVAGEMLGSAMGGYLWRWNRQHRAFVPNVGVGQKSVNLQWDLPL